MTNSNLGVVRRQLRRAFPHRRVSRNVQGVRLELPWEHKLPDYAQLFPGYGQNLVELARRLSAPGQPLGVVDIGANVGDSALQILAATDARVLCVEADEYWLRYLHANVDSEPRVTIAPYFLSTEDDVSAHAPVREGGTTRFKSSEGTTQSGPQILSPLQLKELFLDVGPIRLIKSDTDGYDTRIIPRAAAAWSAQPPALFFEFDPAISRLAGDPHPEQVWGALSKLGYNDFAVWDNFGNALGQATTEEVTHIQSVLEEPLAARGYHYWDVAAFHADDEAGRRAVTELVPERFGVDVSSRQ